MFRKKVDVKGQVRSSQRDIGKGVRDLERELASNKREEQKLIQQIKLSAKNGNQGATRTLAQSLVRLRQQQTKLIASVAHLKGVSTQLTSAAATQTVGKAMKTATGAMQAVGKAVDPKKLHQTMMEFAKENEKQDFAMDLMDDAIETAMDTEETEEETTDLMNEVLDEIGIDLSAQMTAAPRKRVAAPATGVQDSEFEEEDEKLNARLAALKS